MTISQSQEARGEILRSLIVAGLLLGASAALKLLSPGFVSPEFAHRSIGVLMGALVMFYANAAPKSLSPLARMRCDPASEQAMRRFVGWSLTLGGLAYAIASASAPFATADRISVCLLGVAFLLAIARVAWGVARRRADVAPSSIPDLDHDNRQEEE